jgi:ABC-2 type transport system ATP-binding protein
MPRRHALRRAHEVLTYLGLEEARYRRLEDYSTGMKQRLKLGQALVHDPPLLLLDEPTSGLDPAGRDAMLRLLMTLGQDHGKSFILSTHLLSDVERVCDTVVILYGGKVRSQGRTDDLRACRLDRYRLQVEGDLPPFLDDLRSEGAQVLNGMNGQSPAPNGRVSEVRVQVPNGWVTRLFFILADNRGVVVRGLRHDDEDLEELFHRVVRENAANGA